MDDKNKISVPLSNDEFERFDAYCTEKGYKKATLIRRLIREHLAREGFQLQASAASAAETSPRIAAGGSTRRSRGKRA